MKRPLACITAPWGANEFENTENAARYCRLVYDMGFSPVCPLLFLPLFLKDEIPQEHKDGMPDFSEKARNGGNKMRLLLKILFAPVILILTVFVWLCMGILYCSAFLFGLAASIVALLGLAAWQDAGFQVLDSGWDIWIKNNGAGNNLPAPFLLKTTYPLYCFDLLQ